MMSLKTFNLQKFIKLSVFIVIIFFTLKLFVKYFSSFSESEENFNPYKKNDVLIFKSSSGEFDTLKITRVYQDKNYAAQMTFLPDKLLGLTIEAEYKEFENDYFETYERPILEFNKTNNMPATVNFQFSIGENDVFNYQYGQSIEKIINSHQIKLKVNHKILSDIIVIKPDLSMVDNKSNNISKIYWSLKHGYVFFRTMNNKTWRLIKKNNISF